MIEIKTTWQIHTTKQDITKKWVSKDSLIKYLEKEIDSTLMESGNDHYDVGYMDCCNKLINKLKEN